MTDSPNTTAGRPGRYEARAERREEREIRAEQANDKDRRERRAADRYSRARLVVISVVLSCLMSYFISALVVDITATENSRGNCVRTQAALVEIDNVLVFSVADGERTVARLVREGDTDNAAILSQRIAKLKRSEENIKKQLADCNDLYPRSPLTEFIE